MEAERAQVHGQPAPVLNVLPKNRKGAHPCGNLCSTKNEAAFTEGGSRNERAGEGSAVTRDSVILWASVFKTRSPLGHTWVVGRAWISWLLVEKSAFSVPGWIQLRGESLCQRLTRLL